MTKCTVCVCILYMHALWMHCVYSSVPYPSLAPELSVSWVQGYIISWTLELSFTVNCFSPHSTMLSTNEQGVPSESYLQEVQEQLEERSQESEENQHQREARSASDNTGLYKWVMQSVFSPIARLMAFKYKTQTLTEHVHSTRLATWLPFLHESPFPSHPDEADWDLGLVLAETHPMQWLSLCNI